MTESARLRMGDGMTRIEGGSLPLVSVPLDAQSVAGGCFAHDPPTPIELERAIDVVEGAIMEARIAYANRGVLETCSAELRKIPGLNSNGATLRRDDIEEMFNRLAAAAHGQRSALGDIPPDPEVAAALIILRECMHHLGFEKIRAVYRLVEPSRKAF